MSVSGKMFTTFPVDQKSSDNKSIAIPKLDFTSSTSEEDIDNFLYRLEKFYINAIIEKNIDKIKPAIDESIIFFLKKVSAHPELKKCLLVCYKALIWFYILKEDFEKAKKIHFSALTYHAAEDQSHLMTPIQDFEILIKERVEQKEFLNSAVNQVVSQQLATNSSNKTLITSIQSMYAFLCMTDNNLHKQTMKLHLVLKNPEILITENLEVIDKALIDSDEIISAYEQIQKKLQSIKLLQEAKLHTSVHIQRTNSCIKQAIYLRSALMARKIPIIAEEKIESLVIESCAEVQKITDIDQSKNSLYLMKMFLADIYFCAFKRLNNLNFKQQVLKHYSESAELNPNDSFFNLKKGCLHLVEHLHTLNEVKELDDTLFVHLARPIDFKQIVDEGSFALDNQYAATEATKEIFEFLNKLIEAYLNAKKEEQAIQCVSKIILALLQRLKTEDQPKENIFYPELIKSIRWFLAIKANAETCDGMDIFSQIDDSALISRAELIEIASEWGFNFSFPKKEKEKEKKVTISENKSISINENEYLKNISSLEELTKLLTGSSIFSQILSSSEINNITFQTCKLLTELLRKSADDTLSAATDLIKIFQPIKNPTWDELLSQLYKIRAWAGLLREKPEFKEIKADSKAGFEFKKAIGIEKSDGFSLLNQKIQEREKIYKKNKAQDMELLTFENKVISLSLFETVFAVKLVKGYISADEVDYSVKELKIISKEYQNLHDEFKLIAHTKGYSLSYYQKIQNTINEASKNVDILIYQALSKKMKFLESSEEMAECITQLRSKLILIHSIDSYKFSLMLGELYLMAFKKHYRCPAFMEMAKHYLEAADKSLQITTSTYNVKLKLALLDIIDIASHSNMDQLFKNDKYLNIFGALHILKISKLSNLDLITDLADVLLDINEVLLYMLSCFHDLIERKMLKEADLILTNIINSSRITIDKFKIKDHSKEIYDKFQNRLIIALKQRVLLAQKFTEPGYLDKAIAELKKENILTPVELKSFLESNQITSEPLAQVQNLSDINETETKSITPQKKPIQSSTTSKKNKNENKDEVNEKDAKDNNLSTEIKKVVDKYITSGTNFPSITINKATVKDEIEKLNQTLSLFKQLSNKSKSDETHKKYKMDISIILIELYFENHEHDQAQFEIGRIKDIYNSNKSDKVKKYVDRCNDLSNKYKSSVQEVKKDSVLTPPKETATPQQVVKETKELKKTIVDPAPAARPVKDKTPDIMKSIFQMSTTSVVENKSESKVNSYIKKTNTEILDFLYKLITKEDLHALFNLVFSLKAKLPIDFEIYGSLVTKLLIFIIGDSAFANKFSAKDADAAIIFPKQSVTYQCNEEDFAILDEEMKNANISNQKFMKLKHKSHYINYTSVRNDDKPSTSLPIEFTAKLDTYVEMTNGIPLTELKLSFAHEASSKKADISIDCGDNKFLIIEKPDNHCFEYCINNIFGINTLPNPLDEKMTCVLDRILKFYDKVYPDMKPNDLASVAVSSEWLTFFFAQKMEAKQNSACLSELVQMINNRNPLLSKPLQSYLSVRLLNKNYQGELKKIPLVTRRGGDSMDAISKREHAAGQAILKLMQTLKLELIISNVTLIISKFAEELLKVYPKAKTKFISKELNRCIDSVFNLDLHKNFNRALSEAQATKFAKTLLPKVPKESNESKQENEFEHFPVKKEVLLAPEKPVYQEDRLFKLKIIQKNKEIAPNVALRNGIL